MASEDVNTIELTAPKKPRVGSWRAGARSSAAQLYALSRDRLFAGSAALFMNTVVLAAFGFVFATIAARTYSTSSVGVYVSFVAGSQMLGMVAALGWSLCFVRFLPSEPEPRALMLLMTGTVLSIGGLTVVLIELIAGRGLSSLIHVRVGGVNGVLLTMLVVVTALGAVVPVGLVSRRALRPIVLTSLIGALARVGLLLPLSPFGTAGLLGAYTAGTVLALVLAWGALWRTLPRTRALTGVLKRARGYVRYSLLGYVSTVVAILPTTALPLIVIAGLGPTQAAWYAMAASIASILWVLCGAVSQALFAEAGNEPERLTRNAHNAVRGIYIVMIPVVVLVVLIAHPILSILGPSYASHGTFVLRALTVGSLSLGGNYIIDATLAGRDRMTAYTAINLVNAALVVGFALVAVHQGIDAVAVSWALAQAASLAVGVCILAGPSVLANLGARLRFR